MNTITPTLWFDGNAEEAACEGQGSTAGDTHAMPPNTSCT